MKEPEKRALIICEKGPIREWVTQTCQDYDYTMDLASSGYSSLNYVSFEKYKVLFVSTSIRPLKVEDLVPKLEKHQPKAAIALIGSQGERKQDITTSDTPLEILCDADAMRLFLAELEAPRKGKSARPEDAVNIVGSCQKMNAYFQNLSKIQKSSVTVLIHGGSGTGKELTAKSIHQGGPRRKFRFVTVNSAAIPESLLESELFGHEKGAFTGAHERRIGRFELAHKGTLFLDEVGELVPSIQAKFLRVLEEQSFERVGGNETVQVDVRIISATNKNLMEMVKQGKFREDLFYRLNAIPIRVPYLHERQDDIPLLAAFFLEKYLPITGRTHPFTITPRAMEKLTAYTWPGNVRELENVIMRLMVMCDEPVIDVPDLPPEINAEPLSYTSGDENVKLLNRVCSIQELEREAIRLALESCNFNASRAARLLNIGRMTFYRKAKLYAIKLRE